MTLQQPEVVRVFANDLEIYFKGFEVALERKNTEDAVRYLESMIEEIDYTIDRVQSGRDLEIAVENRKRNIKKTRSEYQTGMNQLQGELKRL